MSVNGQTFLGYQVDILKEYKALSDEQREKLDDFDDYIRQGGTRERLAELNFNHYYGELHDSTKSYIKPNKTTIIYDGMSGYYCYLVHVVAYLNSADYDMEDEKIDDVSLLKELNKALEKIEVPDKILQELQEVYKEFFGEKLPNIKDKVKLKYFIHWS